MRPYPGRLVVTAGRGPAVTALLALTVALSGCEGGGPAAPGPTTPSSSSRPPAGFVRVPDVSEFGGQRPIGLIGTTELDPVVATGWKRFGMGTDLAPPRRLQWNTVPVTDQVRLRTPVAPDSVNVIGFQRVGADGIPDDAPSVDARCGKPATTELSCQVEPGNGEYVVRVTAPATIGYLTIQATWLATPADGTEPAEATISWVARSSG
ncbi:hypothetical protein [Actinoplanes sp. NPDC051494]|uniref:hypothetical protein n=1 Tax=Actinoplanes sp. NPDC051494 TaxID=3363907 RepID=UPI0037AD7053